MKRAFFIPVFLLALLPCAVAQDAGSIEASGPDKLTARELGIPTSPLFDLMGVAPSQVARSTDIKDFKVDWSFKSWRLSPNIAIQAQPVWQIFYNRKGIEKYQKSNYVLRTLSSLDVSAGTVQDEVGNRRIGGAVKVSLYKQKDPLMTKGAYDEIQKEFDEELEALKQKEKALLKALDLLNSPAQRAGLRSELADNDLALVTFYKRRNESLQNKAREIVGDSWNAAYLDLAAGKIFTYATDSIETLKTLKLNRNTGSGLWINAGFGIGKKILVSGLIRQSFYEEELNFFLSDTTGADSSSHKAIAANRLLSYGLNVRYGGPVFNFFAEFIFEHKVLKTAVDALNDVFAVPEGMVLINGTVKWDNVHPYTINFGGDWRISRNVVLNYGIRAVFDKNFKTQTFLPIANISCMMR